MQHGGGWTPRLTSVQNFSGLDQQLAAVAFVDAGGQKKPAVQGPVQLALVTPVVLPNRPAEHSA